MSRTKLNKGIKKKIMKQFDMLKKIWHDKTDVLDTQNDVLYLQRDRGKKFFGVDPQKVDSKTLLLKRKLLYNELESRNNSDLYYNLLYLMGILGILAIIILYYKPIN